VATISLVESVIISNIETEIEKKALEIGARVIITYGPRILRKVLRKKLRATLHFVIVVVFYSYPDYQDAYENISKLFDKYRVKKNNINRLKFKSKFEYDYYLSIIPHIPRDDELTDPIMLELFSSMLELPPLDLEVTEYHEALTSMLLRASSAHIFLWPSNLPSEKIEMNDFKEVLRDVYEFHEMFYVQLVRDMKLASLHKFYVRIRSDDELIKLVECLRRRLGNDADLRHKGKTVMVEIRDRMDVENLTRCIFR